ncbi:MAG: hypothetical protein QNL77_06525 [Akkermansiaceae bacterium]
MAKFKASEREKIREQLNRDPCRYGIPKRVYGSAVVGSFNIRKLGGVDKRDAHTWQFLADLCSHYDLLAVQEVMADTTGLERLRDLMGDDYELIVSDTTGASPMNQASMSVSLSFTTRER